MNIFQQFNTTDYVILIILSISTLVSILRGFIREAMSMLVWILAFWIAFTYSAQLGGKFAAYLHTPIFQFAVGFILIFLGILLAGGLLNMLIFHVLSKAGLGTTDRLLGMLFGFARGVLLVATLLLIAGLTDMPKEQWWNSSQLIPRFNPLVTWLQKFIPEQSRNLPKSEEDFSAMPVEHKPPTDMD